MKIIQINRKESRKDPSFYKRKRPFIKFSGVFLLVFLAAAGAAALSVPKAEGAALAVRPLYLEQLDNYRSHLEAHKVEKERQAREEALEKALVQHVVQRGETLSTIAALYETDVASLAYWNGLTNPNLIYPNQVLDILTLEGALYQVKQGDTVEAIARRYSVAPQVISYFNLLEDGKSLAPGKKLVIPGAVVSQEERRVVQAAFLASRGERDYSLERPPAFEWPLRGKITSPFGWRNGSFHYGLDIGAPFGTQVRAAAPGIVDYSGFRGGYGLTLSINHGGGWSTLYAHNSKLLVGRGQEVAIGQPIALVGATGDATGPHLHLEISYNGRRLDPRLYLP